MSKKLGILGGMGTLATAELFKMIALFTDASSDQEHLHILINNNPSIPDRTSYLMGLGEDPRKCLIESAKGLENMGAEFLIMPCNTAHYFYKDIVNEINIPFLNLVEETVNFILDEYPNIKKIGLLATDGTCSTGIYDKYFKDHDIEVIKPTKTMQSYVMDFIYSIKKGHKEIPLELLYETVEEMKQQDVEIFILGCTELSSAYEIFKLQGTFIDPLKVIALRAINFSGKKSL
ncbi:aspartate/glutamate racemase family protein [Oceanirhabdus sp. W0125-5]|uniref:aspartate/glutamate racemase family protein n=1 Tax=Oceanirhabdus sp. W0125-5 TaxID=2999116 RepID=UPI0022F2C739|nr:amino acid racemase [Oceanirhabdus sp. W0125-5]WBW98593.1 amino acid racemase [Oceanirhabdus sp. W0125-5]